MNLGRANGPLARGFERELRRHHGRIGETELALGYGRGHFSRLVREKKPIPVDLMLKALDLLGVDPRNFLAKAYDVTLDPAHLLSLHERPGKVDPVLRRIEKAALRLETADPPERPLMMPRDFQRRIEPLVRSNLASQRKALRRTKMFRQPAFLAEYLEHLDAMRYRDVAKAAKLAETVALDLIPRVPGRRWQLVGSMCKALGVYASTKRPKAELDVAAAAIGFGLRLAGRHGLSQARADLLQRGAYVLRDNAEFDRALELLGEAQLLYLDAAEFTGVCKTWVDRATMLYHQGEHEESIQLFKLALNHLPKDDPHLDRWRVAAFTGIAIGYRHLGELIAAGNWLLKAMEGLDPSEVTTWATLDWVRGVIAYDKEEFEPAEILLKKACKVLTAEENPIQGALVSLDLAAVLFARGRLDELCELAMGMAAMLTGFSDNKLARAALMELIRAGIEGTVTRELIEEVSRRLMRGELPAERAVTRPTLLDLSEVL